MCKWRYSGKDWKAINNNTLEFIFRQSENNLKETIVVSNQITSRAYQILSVSITLITVALGYIIKSSNNTIETDPYLIISWIALLCLGTAIYFLFRVIFPRDIILLGSQPKILMSQNQIEKYDTEDVQLKFFILNECENYQHRIVFNSTINEQRIEHLKKVLILIISIPVISFLIFLYLSLS